MPAAQNIRDLLFAEFGAAVSPRLPNLGSIGGAIAEILKQDPSRIGVIFANTGSTDIGIVPGGQNGPQRSFVLAALGGTLISHWREDGELVSQTWAAFAVAPPGSLLVVEAIIQKNAPEVKP